MSLIDKKIKFKKGDKEHIGTVLDKYTKAMAWDTGNGMVSGNFDQYIVLVDNEIKHINPDKIIGIVDN